MIINLGLPKTGTTTLSRALRRAGLSTADWKVRAGQTDDAAMHGAFVGEILYTDYFATGDPLARLKVFDGITEMNALSPRGNYWPQTDWALIDAMRTHHPETRFILSWRDPARTAGSMMRWKAMGTRRLPRHQVPGLPKGWGGTETELARWIDGHQRFCAAIFAGSDRFLAYDIEDREAPARIGAFIGRALPWWGVSNSNPEADEAAVPDTDPTEEAGTADEVPPLPREAR
ncbi:sulfotransferase family protein [Roseivivax sediminis]|uniref:Sulfotransferase family protein n=1 Tax=Roseivivax sediminis TaxID=936889 RepID=A0A1I1YFC6_9RHOB|nr:sulfotransferase [Roseivivax sediminis]SFE18305.1 hypothetical protein SAMN04515678_10725 [Roseivivax sediminis]